MLTLTPYDQHQISEEPAQWGLEAGLPISRVTYPEPRGRLLAPFPFVLFTSSEERPRHDHDHQGKGRHEEREGHDEARSIWTEANIAERDAGGPFWTDVSCSTTGTRPSSAPSATFP